MNKRHLFRNTIGIIIGSIIYGVAYAWFLIPFKIAPGGVGGLAQIFYHIFHMPAGLSMILMNIPLFILAVKLVGKQFGIGSLFGMLMGSVFTDLFAVKHIYKLNLINTILEKYNQGKPIEEWAMTDSSLLAAIAGSILLGTGVGIIFRCKGSTGGTDIPVAIFKKYFNFSITTGYLVIETGIIILIGLIFKDPNVIIWGFFTLFLTSRVCDIAAEGLPYTKGIYIISDKHEELKKVILERVDRGVTVFHGEGGYSGEPKKIIFCVINHRQISILRDWVQRIDPDAFMVVAEINDVMGYGFKTRRLEMGDS